ncbi:MAG: hypothetical protein IJC39_00370 [Firmicutes bacterium]|nr:hypothetical protein [Bacillota bacterium]
MKTPIKNELVDKLFECILAMESVEECYQLFEDLCTVNELTEFSKRMEVARMLCENYTYLEIAEATRASTATISRVNRTINYGADGYRLALSRVKEKKEKEMAENAENAENAKTAEIAEIAEIAENTGTAQEEILEALEEI